MVSSIIVLMGFIVSVFISGVTFADLNNIEYPVKELGNCESKEKCKSYCDDPLNTETCLRFAEEKKLMTGREIDVAKKFLNSKEKGPGGCTTKDSCEEYCDNIEHIKECVSFAEKTGILSSEELEEAKQIERALDKGLKPPCKSKKECDIFCEEPANIESCVSFAEAAGFLNGEDLRDAKKMISAIKQGAVPPKCRSKDDCDKYCEMEENLMECLNFAEAAGFVSKEEADMARKTGGKGPGGCRGKEECDAFCENNQDLCFDFAREKGLIPEEEIKQMEEGNKGFMEGVSNAPPLVKECLIEVFGSISNAKPSREGGKKLENCYKLFGQSNQNEPERRGPGGCSNREECDAYCIKNPIECRPDGGENMDDREERQMDPKGREMNYEKEGYQREFQSYEGEKKDFESERNIRNYPEGEMGYPEGETMNNESRENFQSEREYPQNFSNENAPVQNNTDSSLQSPAI